MDTDKIKDFFIQHFEKMILGVVICAAGFLLFKGSSAPIFTANQDPDRLQNEATQIKADIDLNHNDQIIPERIPTLDIVAATKRSNKPIDPSGYKQLQPWEGGGGTGEIVRRQDPQLLSPMALVMTPIVTSIAIREDARNPGYALEDLDGADAVEVVKKRVRRQRRSRRGGGGAGGMEEEMGGGEDEMEDMGSMDMLSEMGGDGEGLDPSMDGAGAGRTLDPKYDRGFRPSPTDDKRNPVPAVVRFIAGTAVVPHKKLYDAFEMALRDNDQYDPRRDTPIYYNIQLQRADVTDKPVDQLADEDWVLLPWNRGVYTQLAGLRWSGFAPEIVPNDYRDAALTTWIPPILLDDYTSIATHPLIPMIPQAELNAQDDSESTETEFQVFSIDGGDIDLVDRGFSGGSEESEMEMDNMEGMESEMGMGGMGGMGMAMMGRGGIEADPVDYKLVRFYDFAGYPDAPKLGRTYVYRLRYSVNDPNFPLMQSLQPRINSLSDDVAKRVQGLMAKARAEKSRKKLFQRWSEWSEPSAPTSLPSGEQYFVGPVERGRVSTWNVGGREVEYASEAPKAKLVESQFDKDLGVRIPMRLDITEGTVLSKKLEATDVVDPITLKIKKLPDAEIVSSTTVIAIDGGTPLTISGGSRETVLKEPALMLLFDQTGQLRVSDEVSDQESYRTYSFADERGE